MAADLETYFDQGGYSASWDHQGYPGSLKANILSDINYLMSNYDEVAVVMFDHGVGRSDYSVAPPGEFHYMMEDNRGTEEGEYPGTDRPDRAVYDMDIYPYTYGPGTGTLTFAFINTCMSADTSEGQGYLEPDFPYPGRARGMPYAWTHRLVKDKDDPDFNKAYHISDDGYNDPDTGDQVYIGFPWGSASLNQTIPLENGDTQYGEWVDKFFEYTLYYGYSVKSSLDVASLIKWGDYFDDSPLQFHRMLVVL